MKNRITHIALIILSLITHNLYTGWWQNKNNLFKVNSPNWIQTDGPPGGAINDIAIDHDNPSIVYAVGPKMNGIKS